MTRQERLLIAALLMGCAALLYAFAMTTRRTWLLFPSLLLHLMMTVWLARLLGSP